MTEEVQGPGPEPTLSSLNSLARVLPFESPDQLKDGGTPMKKKKNASPSTSVTSGQLEDGGTPMKRAVTNLDEWFKEPQLTLQMTDEFKTTWESIVDHVHELAFLSRSDKKVTTVYAHLMNNEGSLMLEYASSAMTKRMDTLSYEILIENLRKFMKVNYENGLYIRIFKVETTGSTDTSYYKLTKAPTQQIWKPYRYYQQRTKPVRRSNVTHPSGGGGRAFGPGPTGPHPGLRVK